MGAKSRVMIIPASSTDNQTIEKPVKEEKNGVAVGSLLNDSKALIVPDNLNITGDKKSELPIEKQLFASENINKEAATNDISEKTDVSLHTSDKKNNVRGFYAGLILGPQFNQVNSQGFNKVGGEAGLLFGYSFNQKFSVESGLYLSNKKYYSDGKYFNMDKIISAMPTSMKVITVISNTTLLEIPLKAKYNFSSNKNSDLFVTVGVSSYLLLREQNDYQALVNGGQENIKGDYGTMRKYFAASLSLSVGYQKSIGKGTQVRIEPYLEFPIRELGVGSMSVFSTGLHLGIAFPLRKR